MPDCSFPQVSSRPQARVSRRSLQCFGFPALLLMALACSDDSTAANPDPGQDVGVELDAAEDAAGDDARDLTETDAPPDDVSDDVEHQPDAGEDFGADAGYEGWTAVPDFVTDQLLCDIPTDYVDTGGDPYFIDALCSFEADGTLSDREPAVVPGPLRVVAWNIHFGTDSADVMTELSTHPELMNADFILLSEASRNDKESDPANINQTRSLATALSMNYVFAVEWDRRLNADQGGEHGLAILSKYPLGNANMIRHAPQNDWWSEKNIYGGRATLAATAKVGDRYLRVYSTHLDTRGFAGGRAEQGAEIRSDADLPERADAQLIGGDFNTYLCNPIIADCTTPPAAEKVIQDFLNAGWSDGTAGFNGITHEVALVVRQRLDWIFYRGLSVTPGTVVSDARGSDHLPIYTDVVW